MAFPAPENLSKSLPFRDADDDLCPDNLSFIKRLAAVGDSYSTPPARPIKPVDQLVLRYKHTQPSRQVQEDTELRILPIGDSITVGFLSDTHGGDGDGCRRQLIPGIVNQRKDAGKHVLAVDFITFDAGMLQDCIHPTNAGYKLMGD
jgi:hypothetical protein